MRAPLTASVGVLVEITFHVRRHHNSPCAHFILECAPHELEQLGSHCSCSLSFASISRHLSFLSADLSVSSHSAALSAGSLSLKLSRLLFLALCASFSEGPSPSTLAQSTRFDHDRVSSLASPRRAPSPFCASSASFMSEHCKLQKSPAKYE